MSAYASLLLLPLLVVQVVWVHRFLTRVRPRLRQRWSERLGVQIVDGPRGAWAAAPGSGIVKGTQVAVLDIGLLIGATLGPLAIVLVLLVALAG